jgi:uncharacterized membrane protein
MQPTRCHISMILEKSLSTLRQLVPTIVIMFVSLRSLKLIWIVLGIAVLIVLAFAYLFLLWRKTFVFTDQDQLTVTHWCILEKADIYSLRQNKHCRYEPQCSAASSWHMSAQG